MEALDNHVYRALVPDNLPNGISFVHYEDEDYEYRTEDLQLPGAEQNAYYVGQCIDFDGFTTYRYDGQWASYHCVHDYSDKTGKCAICGEVCDHSGNTSKHADNGDGTHTYTCSVCKAAAAEAHTRDITYVNLEDQGHKAYYPCCQTPEAVEAGDHSYENSDSCLCGRKLPLVITRQPADQEAKLGKRVTVKLEAEGADLQYQWYYRKAGSEAWNISSTTTDTYQVYMNPNRAWREIKCVVTDRWGRQVESDVAQLIPLKTKDLQITQQPTQVIAEYGEKFSTLVTAQGDGLKCQWYIRNAGSRKFYRSSIKKAAYSTVMNQARNDRLIYCVITDMWGNKVQTETVRLIGISGAELKIVTQPVSDSAAFGKRVSSTVVAEGDGLTYQWYYRNAGAKKFLKSSTTNDTYQVYMLNHRNGREIYCVITDIHGNSVTSDTVTISMTK